MNKPVAVGLLGIGGYGHQHLSALRTLQSAGICRLMAVADPFAFHRAGDVAALRSEGVGVYESTEELCAHEDMEAVFIATPIPLHVSQTVLALHSGKHVYLEKPPCATLGELAQLENAQNASGKTCTVGFQLQTAPAIQFVKRQICDGAIGRLQTVHASIRWRRDDAYYARALWAGQWCLQSDSGKQQPVFDGPATNALAHVAHAALFLAGARESDWAGVLRVRGSLKKAREIESYDSSFLEVETASGVLVRLAFTHASGAQDAVVLNCAGEIGSFSVDWSGDVTHSSREQSATKYSFPCDPHYAALLHFFQSLNDSQTRPATTLADTRPYLQAVNGALQSSEGAPMFAPEIIQSIGEGSERYFTVAGLDEEMVDFSHNAGSTPSLLVPGAWIEAENIASDLVV